MVQKLANRLTVFFLAIAMFSMPFCTPMADAHPGDRQKLSRHLERRAQVARERAERQAKQQLRRATHSFRRMQMSGTEVRANVSKLLQLDWHKDLQLAQQDAQSQGKPILWIQALGDLEGHL